MTQACGCGVRRPRLRGVRDGKNVWPPEQRQAAWRQEQRQPDTVSHSLTPGVRGLPLSPPPTPALPGWVRCTDACSPFLLPTFPCQPPHTHLRCEAARAAQMLAARSSPPPSPPPHTHLDCEAGRVAQQQDEASHLQGGLRVLPAGDHPHPRAKRRQRPQGGADALEVELREGPGMPRSQGPPITPRCTFSDGLTQPMPPATHGIRGVGPRMSDLWVLPGSGVCVYEGGRDWTWFGRRWWCSSRIWSRMGDLTPGADRFRGVARWPGDRHQLMSRCCAPVTGCQHSPWRVAAPGCCNTRPGCAQG